MKNNQSMAGHCTLTLGIGGRAICIYAVDLEACYRTVIGRWTCAKFTYGTMRVFDWLLTIYVGPGLKVYHKVNCLKSVGYFSKV